MQVYGLIGKRLGHSFSPAFFREKFVKLNLQAEYRLFEMEHVGQAKDLPVQFPGLVGFNVTVPFKRDMLELLDEAEPVVREIKAVNTVKVVRTEERILLTGYNTDVKGFEQSLIPFIKGKEIRKALILGTGGSAAAVALVLRSMAIDVLYVSRTPDAPGEIPYQALSGELFREYPLIINTTPLGMFPQVKTCPDIPFQDLSGANLVYDLVYNPLETLFLKNARKSGAAVKSGIEMLHLQAEESWNIWQSAR